MLGLWFVVRGLRFEEASLCLEVFCTSLDQNLARQKKTPSVEKTAASHEETASQDEFFRHPGTFMGSEGLPAGVKGYLFQMMHVSLILRTCKSCRILLLTAMSS